MQNLHEFKDTMPTVLLDTSFILTCIKQKIDFFEYLALQDFKMIIPLQVIHEIQRIAKRDLNAQLALTIIQKYEHKQIDLNTHNVDEGIINHAKKHPSTYIGTLDSEIKNRIKNRKIVIRNKKKLEVI